MDDSVGDRVKLYCLDKGAFHLAVRKAEVDDVRFCGVNQFVQFKLVDADCNGLFTFMVDNCRYIAAFCGFFSASFFLMIRG